MKARVVTFRVGGSGYAIPADSVREVVEATRVRPLPFAGRPGLLGLARVRERFVPVVEIGEGGDPDAAEGEVALLVLGEGRGRLGLRIEELGDVVLADLARAQATVENGPVIRVGDELIRYVEPDALVDGRKDLLTGTDTGGSKVEGKVDEKLRLVSFRIGPEEFALDVMRVHEVLRVPEILRVPRAPEFVEGMAEVRDAVVPVIDLRKRFGAASPPVGPENRLLVISVEDEQVGVVVDAVPGVLEYPAEALSPAPRLVRGLKARYLEGVIRDDEADRMLILLDVAEVLESDEKIALKGLIEERRDDRGSKRKGTGKRGRKKKGGG